MALKEKTQQKKKRKILKFKRQLLTFTKHLLCVNPSVKHNMLFLPQNNCLKHYFPLLQTDTEDGEVI